eukprot:TRINITY_DN26209_c0_g1_i1.p1 TRINITY_DN26209_c0_g1~~TRINITY_DN26209_c0_g1_i1.p1  ORF type:complete len:402 (+),score=88.03 TRINITY_DN26209_c0_g1_i1:84-1289(+)
MAGSPAVLPAALWDSPRPLSVAAQQRDCRASRAARLAAAAGVGCAAAAGLCLWKLRRARSRLSARRERDLLLVQHTASGERELAAADVQQGADRTWRGALCLHVACSRIDGDTAALLRALLTGPPALSVATRQEGMVRGFSRCVLLRWALTDGTWSDFLLGRGPYALLDTSLPAGPPAARLCRTARHLYETQRVWSLDHFLDALAVVADGAMLDMNQWDAAGTTPLLLCVEPTARPSERFAEGSLRVLLSVGGVDVNRGHRVTQATALHVLCARMCNSADTPALLRCLGALLAHPDAAPNVPDAEGRTPLHCLVRSAAQAAHSGAAQRAAAEAAQLLLSRGASVTHVDAEGTDPFVFASRHKLQLLCAALAAAAPSAEVSLHDFTMVDRPSRQCEAGVQRR